MTCIKSVPNNKVVKISRGFKKLKNDNSGIEMKDIFNVMVDSGLTKEESLKLLLAALNNTFNN